VFLSAKGGREGGRREEWKERGKRMERMDREEGWERQGERKRGGEG
jgi:hypothetical protein